MSHVWIAKFATMAEVEAEQDDPSSADLDFMSAPQVSHVILDLKVETVDRLLEVVRQELIDEMIDDDQPRSDFADLKWRFAGYHVPTGRREHLIWHLVDVDEDIVARLVIQKVEVFP